MNNQEAINKFLTEKFLGECWHEFPEIDLDNPKPSFCRKCGELEFGFVSEDENPHRLIFSDSQDLFTPEGFFLLWEKAQKEEWWKEFLRLHMPFMYQCSNANLQPIINPLTFPILLAEFLGWKEGE